MSTLPSAQVPLEAPVASSSPPAPVSHKYVLGTRSSSGSLIGSLLCAFLL